VDDVTHARLLQLRDRPVEIECKDGEVIMGDLVYVCEHDREVFFDLEYSNRASRYGDRWIGFHVYGLSFDDITDVRLSDR
jgi:hypothetical protein